MVQLSKESIAEWKKIFKEEYGAKYTDEEASEAAHNLVNFFYLLLKVDQRNKFKDKAGYKQLFSKKDISSIE